MRLDKYLADAGVGTRSELKQYIRKRAVTVNGGVVTDAGMHVQQQDIVCFNGKQVLLTGSRYFMLNKPAGCVSATRDAGKTVLDLLYEPQKEKLFPVGRLDKDTEGLLLLTDDGSFAHALTSPRRHVEKTYYFEAEGVLVPNAILQAAEGIDIGDEKKTLPAVLTITQSSCEDTGKTIGTLTICEGRYHQVKRMLAKLGGKVTYLKRLSIGELKLDESLLPGQYRALTKEEIALFG
jgi:16S rRNA pseudouridine516 synthase